jgi:hypothetical protein
MQSGKSEGMHLYLPISIQYRLSLQGACSFVGNKGWLFTPSKKWCVRYKTHGRLEKKTVYSTLGLSCWAVMDGFFESHRSLQAEGTMLAFTGKSTV